MYVKIVFSDLSTEIVECERMSVQHNYTASPSDSPSDGSEPGTVGVLVDCCELNGPVFLSRFVSRGSIYIMNHEGKTIDAFDLTR